MANHSKIDLPSDPEKSVFQASAAAEQSDSQSSGSKFNPASALTRLVKPPRKALLWAVMLLGGGAIAYFNFSQNAPRSLSPAGTQLVPQTALATLTLTTDELTWTKLRQFGTPDTQEQFDNFLRQWKDQLFTLNGYRFKRDIKPWVGDRVTLALLPSDSDSIESGLGAAQNMVLMVPIADALKAKALLEDSPVESREVRKYRGFDVQTIASSGGQPLEMAVIGTDWLLLSNTAEGIEQAIDTQKGKRSLLDKAGYRKALARIDSPQPRGKNFAQVYLNLPAASQALTPPVGTQNRPSGSLLPLQGSEGMVATALIESEGIRFQGTSWLSPKNDLAYGDLRNEAGDMPRRLPENTLLAMTGSNLKQAWESFSEGNTSPPFFPNPQNLKAGLLTQTGLDIDEDIMPWAAGEFAIGILPPKRAEASADQPADQTGDVEGTASSDSTSSDSTKTPVIESSPLVVMVQTNDRQIANSVWSQLDDVMVDRYRYQVETTEVEGGSVTEWISPFQGVQFSHGWLPGNVAFFAVGDGAADVIAPSPGNPLATTRQFQTLTSSAPRPNNGHFYIDLDSINDLGGVFPLPPIPEDGPTAAIRSIGLTSTVGDRTMDYDLYVKLEKASETKPL